MRKITIISSLLLDPTVIIHCTASDQNKIHNNNANNNNNYVVNSNGDVDNYYVHSDVAQNNGNMNISLERRLAIADSELTFNYFGINGINVYAFPKIQSKKEVCVCFSVKKKKTIIKILQVNKKELDQI